MKVFVWALVLAMSLPRVGAAEPRALTLAEAVALAQHNAVSVVRAEGQMRTTRAGMRSAAASFLPSVSLSAGASRQLPAGGSTRVENGQVITVASEPWSSSLGLGASLQLFDGGARLFDLQQAKASHVSARANEIAQRYQAALDAKQSFFDVLASRESQTAAAAQLEQAERQRVVAVAKSRARTATRSDSLRAEIQVRAAQLAVTQAANALESANASLTRVVGSLEPVTAADGDSVDVKTLSVDDAALTSLVEHGPAVQGAEADLDAARASLRSTWTAYLPSVGASYSRSGSGTGDSPAWGSDDLNYSGSLRFSLSFPVFDQLQREQRVTQAQVSASNAEATLRDTRLAATQSLVQWLGTFHTAGLSVESAIATVEAADEDLRVQKQRYASSESTLLDVLTSQTQLDQARRDLIRARYDQRVARAQLEALAGRDL